MEDVTPYFLSTLKDCEEFEEAKEIVKNNSQGNIWLIGGFIYRNIASALYGAPKPEVDLDFIVEVPVEEFNLPNGWTVQRNRFGNPKLVNGKKQIDYVPMNNIYYIKEENLAPTIDNFLLGAPLTIQAVAFDVYQNKLIFGDKFLDALSRRVVEVQNPRYAQNYSYKKQTPLNVLIQSKADDLQFKAIFPE